LKWIRIWTEETVTGSTFKELDAEARAVWFSLLPLAGMNTPEGCVSAFQGTVPMNDAQLSEILRLDIEVIKRGIKRLLEVGKLEVLANGVLKIVKWTHYQGYDNEYERQKYYRENRKQELWLQEKNNEKTQKPQFTSISISKSKSKGVLGGAQKHAAFDKFWAIYPRAEMKGQSWRSYVKHIQNAEDEGLVQRAAENYAAKCKARGTKIDYIKFAASFLKDDYWRDWLEDATPLPKPHKNSAEVEAMLARGRNRGGMGNRGGGDSGGGSAGAGHNNDSIKGV